MKTMLALLFVLLSVNPAMSVPLQKATFAGGCFWCMEGPFESQEGVSLVESGYTGGRKENPTYEEVCTGETGHYEAIQITFDPKKVSYKTLLEIFWRQIDPTDSGGQFVDRGSQYRSAVFYQSVEQKKIALKSKKALGRSGLYNEPIVTDILPFLKFYPAEETHQDYYKKSASKYKMYRSASGRDQYLEKTWGSCRLPMKEDVRKKLSELQYHVTQECGTEKPFDNAYWDNHREGIYVDVVNGEPLFSSKDKFDSGTGWPSFTKPIEPAGIVAKEDKTLFRTRTEVRSKKGDSHLGHVFEDGPNPTGLRFCINSASLRFIPKEYLEKEGYGQYRKLFEH